MATALPTTASAITAPVETAVSQGLLSLLQREGDLLPVSTFSRSDPTVVTRPLSRRGYSSRGACPGRESPRAPPFER